MGILEKENVDYMKKYLIDCMECAFNKYVEEVVEIHKSDFKSDYINSYRIHINYELWSYCFLRTFMYHKDSNTFIYVTPEGKLRAYNIFTHNNNSYIKVINNFPLAVTRLIIERSKDVPEYLNFIKHQIDGVVVSYGNDENRVRLDTESIDYLIQKYKE